MNSSTPANLTTTPDQAAAHQFLTELRTRISTQPLPYQFGVEARALESMWEVFGEAREAIKKNAGCEEFAARATEVLNVVVRPLTAKWHRALEEGRLNGRDGADEFRGELQGVQQKLRAFANELHVMAYGTPHTDALTPNVMTDADMQALFQSLPFGFTSHAKELDAIAVGIRNDENPAVAARRDRRGVPTADGTDAIGLALSGGGIRSATFCLGVVQVLADKGFLKEVDFLSTVSGGGYTGCFLTQRLGGGEPLSDVAGPDGPDPEPVRYVRQHARFLSPSNLKEKWSMVTATLAGMLLNWTAPVLVLVVLALIATQFGAKLSDAWPDVLQTSAALCVVAMIIYGVGIRQGNKVGLVTGRVLGGLLAFTGLVGVGWLLDSIVPQFLTTIESDWKMSGSIGALLATVAAVVPAIIRFVPVLKEPKVRTIALKVALVLAGLLVPVTAVLLFYALCGIERQHHGSLAWVAGTLALVALFVININLTGPHRLYRDALARTFIQKSRDGTPDVSLAEINPQGTAPYHLLNAALNVPGSQSAALKDRGCDFFLFSKRWMGSTSTGYERTETWKASGANVDLATAMAVSGAAFAPHMGLGSLPTLTALLTLLNVRLGYWLKRPPAASRFSAPASLACSARCSASAFRKRPSG